MHTVAHANNASSSMPALYRPTVRSPSPERAVMLQRYLALHTQQSTIRRRISESSSPSPPLSPKSQVPMRGTSPEMSSSEPSSASPSPTLEGTRFPQLSPPAYALPQPAAAAPRTRTRSSRPSIAPIPEDDSLDEFEVTSPNEERKLYNINHEIKTTLTDLLNCEAVRNDTKMRLWIQSRLMDAERELKRQRRSRQRISSLPTPTIVLTPVEIDDDRRGSV